LMMALAQLSWAWAAVGAKNANPTRHATIDASGAPHMRPMILSVMMSSPINHPSHRIFAMLHRMGLVNPASRVVGTRL
jgi:hypothetical protein